MTQYTREAYTQYKAKLLARAEELLKAKEYGAEYARFWKFIETTYKEDLLVYHSLSLLVVCAYIHSWN